MTAHKAPDLTIPAGDLLTDCERSMRYHSSWNLFYYRLHCCLMLLFFMSGSAVFAEFDAGGNVWWGLSIYKWVGAATALIAALSVIIDLPGKRALHKSLYQRYAMLASDVVACDATERKQCERKWSAAIYNIYREEPPGFRAANEHAHNQMCIQLGNKSELIKMRWWHYCFMHWLPFNNSEFPYRNPELRPSS